eukprot:TRINITY_DN29685_c0_g1_i1.p2 TRINITY_DN29685_c0_g1~~TRINITY_DN29685_c0_g1_i1.p2  ORF type:complete len:128 (-),score=38.80 TRINITY_DN29685_c0_g1_i1:365-748(-)
MNPHIFNDMRDSPYGARFWPCFEDSFLESGSNCSDSEKGVRNAVMLFLGTPYCIGSVLAMIMNLILPADMEVVRATPEKAKLADTPEAEASAEAPTKTDADSKPQEVAEGDKAPEGSEAVKEPCTDI